MIAGACLACLGIGYFTGSNRVSTTKSDGSGEPTQNTRQERSSSRDRMARGAPTSDDLFSGILKGRSLQDLSEVDLVELVVQLSKYESGQDPLARAKKSYQLQLLLGKLPAARLEEAAEAIASDPDSRRYGSASTVIAALASKDPQRALAWAKEQENSGYLLANVITSVAKDDPFAAAEIHRNGLLDGTFGQSDGWSAATGIGYAMAKLGKEPLLDYVNSLSLRQQGNVLSNSFRELPEVDKLAMIDEIYSRSKDGRMEDWSFRHIFSNAVIANPSLAESWLAKMDPGKESAALALSVVGNLSQTAPEAAREWMSRAISQSKGSEIELLQDAIQQMSNRNPADITTFAGLLPEGIEIRAEDLKDRARSSVSNGLNGLPEIAGIIREPAEQAKLITEALDQFTKNTESSSSPTRLNSNDFEIFESRLKSLGLTGEDAEKVQAALDGARNARPKKDK